MAERGFSQIELETERDFDNNPLLERTLSLSDEAKNELNMMNLHGKARKKTIKWHKSQLKKEIKKNPLLKPTYEEKIDKSLGIEVKSKVQVGGAATGVIE